MTVDDLRFGNTLQRNPLVAQFCSRTMQYRGIGTGILRAFREGAQMEFDNSESGNQFAVKFTRPVEGISQSDKKAVNGVNVMDLYPDLMERCPNLPKTEQNNARVVLHLCELSASVVEMMEATGYESRTSFRRKILTPLLEAGLIKPVLEEKNSPKQRYTV
ncbi:MAG: Fic family protein [Prevotella sp.]